MSWRWFHVRVNTSNRDDIYILSCIGRSLLNGLVGIQEIVEMEKVENNGYELYFRVWLHRKRIYGIYIYILFICMIKKLGFLKNYSFY